MNATKKNETTRILRVSFTDAEILELGRNLAEAHNENNQIESDFQRIKDEFKSKLSAVAAKIVDLANKVSSGYEMKPIVCAWHMNMPLPGKK
jgi:ferritin-like metal-binding protein YciE